MRLTGVHFSSEIWETLSALPTGAERTLNGVTVRKVTAELFEVANARTGPFVGRLLLLPAIVRAVMEGDAYKMSVDFADGRRPENCHQCGRLTRRRGSAIEPLCRCATCGLAMCGECLAIHQERHDADPDYRLAPSGDELERSREEYTHAVEVLGRWSRMLSPCRS